MEDLLAEYRNLIRLLEEDEFRCKDALEGEFLNTYRNILREERMRVEDNMKKLQRIW